MPLSRPPPASDGETKQDSRETAARYRKQAAETKDAVKRKELETYADDIEAKLVAEEADQQEG